MVAPMPKAPARPPFVRDIVLPRLGRRIVANLRIHAIDAGWTRRQPLKTHVVVCGFPRGGTTLLSLMLQTAYPQAKAFPTERAALRVAYLADRDHSLIITKKPDDVFFLEEIRRTYRSRRPSVRFLIVMRDPRSVLTSVHASKKDHYYVSPERWRATYECVVAARSADDCFVLRFEDLVTKPFEVQAAVARFLGAAPRLPFTAYQQRVPPGFKQVALNGLRPLDPSAVTSWSAPAHAERIQSVLQELPELPEALIATGYESDFEWVRPYTSSNDSALTG